MTPAAYGGGVEWSPSERWHEHSTLRVTTTSSEQQVEETCLQLSGNCRLQCACGPACSMQLCSTGLPPYYIEADLHSNSGELRCFNNSKDKSEPNYLELQQRNRLCSRFVPWAVQFRKEETSKVLYYSRYFPSESELCEVLDRNCSLIPSDIEVTSEYCEETESCALDFEVRVFQVPAARC